MAGERLAETLGTIKTVFEEGTFIGISDGELLGRFLAGRDAGAGLAFEALVARHGPMVLRVCRARLRDAHEAEDAAQATFLVLARHARSVRHSESVGSWLFGVASRVSARARSDAARRQHAEMRGGEQSAGRHEVRDSSPETWEELYQELERLPERYRQPIILFHLEGLTYEETAQQLRCSVRTIQTRLARGRERLRGRMSRRGLAPSAGLFVASPAIQPPGWAEKTAKVVVGLTAGPSTVSGMVPVSVVVLAEGVSKMLVVQKVKVAALSLLGVGLVSAGALGVTFPLAKSHSQVPPPTTEPTPPARPKALEVALAPETQEPRELKHDDGKSAGMRSIAGGGHAVKFEAPGEGWVLSSVRLFGSRYGYPKPPAEDFEVYLCDENFHKLSTFKFPYSTFRRGEPKWVSMDVKPTVVPRKFIIGVGFDPAQTKGIYVHHDSKGSGSSLTGLPDVDEPEPFDKGDWLIRARLNPPGSKPSAPAKD